MLQDSQQPSRRKTLKDLRNVFKIAKNPELNLTQKINAHSMVSLALPNSLPSLEQMSPALWSWILTGEQKERLSVPMVFTPAGEVVPNVPKHLMTVAPPLPVNRRPLEAKGNVDNSVKYMLVNVKNLLFDKLQYSEIIALVSMDDQKQCTSVLKLSKQQGGFYVDASEAFLFEVPKDKDSVVISVRLYSNSNAALPSQGSSSFLNMGMSFIKRADSQASFSTLHSQYNHGVSSKCPADPTSLGEYLGEYSSKIPADQAFSKVELHFPIATGRHSTAKLLLSAGIFCGTRYSPLLDVPKELATNEGYLNFQLSTKGGLIWDKKWIVATEKGLKVFSYAYRQERAPFAWIPFKQIVSVKDVDRLTMAAAHTFKIQLSLPWLNDPAVFTPRAITIQWKDMFTEAGDDLGDVLEVYVMADTEIQFQRWRKFIEFHSMRLNPKRSR